MAGGADRAPWELEVWLDRVSAVEGTRRYSVDQGLGRKVRSRGSLDAVCKPYHCVCGGGVFCQALVCCGIFKMRYICLSCRIFA